MKKIKVADCERIASQLKNERSSFEPLWKETLEWILPMRARFDLEQQNRGDRRNKQIIDSTATYSSNVMRAGMMSGVTSPSRPWFKLGVADPVLDKTAAVRRWLDEVEEIMRATFTRSNLYNTLPIVYGDLSVPGTSAMLIEKDPETVFRTYVFPVGSFWVSTNNKGVVDCFYREFKMTVRQIVEEFGNGEAGEDKIDWTNISDNVRDAWKNNLKEKWVYVRHLIKSNPNHVPGSLSDERKRYVSLYWESGGSGELKFNNPQTTFLRNKGMNQFTVLCPRWEVSAGDAYATNSPGITCLGDVKQLQVGEKISAVAIQKQADPPMVGTPDVESTSTLPGGISITSNIDAFRQAQAINLAVGDLEMKQAQVRERIRQSFYVDLFLMLANTDRSNITATEIRERYEEKLLALGPVLQQLNQDLLNPLIDITFEMHMEDGLFPEPPEELQGMPLKVEYISIMAQAQKMVGISSLDKFTGYWASLLQIDPNAKYKVDVNEIIESYADFTGIPARVVRTQEEVQVLLQQEAELRQMQMMQQMEAQAAQTNMMNARAGQVDQPAVDDMIRENVGL